MSKQLTKLLNIMQNNMSGKSNKFRNKRGKRRKYTAVPQMSKRPQRLGIGSTNARVTREISVTQNSNTTVDFMSLIMESYEFSRQAEVFMYFRVKCINVIQHPINVNDVNGKVWLCMDWINNTNVSDNTMGTWDNAKMLSYNAVRPITYTFLPPNARLRYQIREDELTYSDLPINFTEWIPASEMVANSVPGWLKFMNVGNKDISVTAEAVLEFKGAKGYDTVLSKASKFYHIASIKEIEQEKIEKKEEEKKCEKEEREEREKRKREKKKEIIKEFKEKMQDLSD